MEIIYFFILFYLFFLLNFDSKTLVIAINRNFKKKMKLLTMIKYVLEFV